MKHKFLFSLSISLFVFALFIRLLLLQALPLDRIINVDEIELASSTQGLLAGLTPTTLTWPANSLLLISETAYGIYMLSNLGGTSISDFGKALATQAGMFYFDPVPLVSIGRLIVALLSSAVTIPVFLWGNKLFSRPVGILMGSFIALSPFTAMQSITFSSHSVALLPFAVFLFLLLTPQVITTKNYIWGGICLGLALTLTYSYAIFVIIPILLFLIGRINNKATSTVKVDIRNLMYFFVSLTITVILFLPQIWTAPLIVAKSLIGNVFATQGSGLTEVFTIHFPSLVGILGLLFISIGVLLSVTIKKYRYSTYGVIVGFSTLLFLLPFFRSGASYTRHLLPLLPLAAFFIGVLADWLSHFTLKVTSRSLVVIGVGAFIIIPMVIQVLDMRQRQSQPNSQEQCIDWIEQNLPSNSHLLVNGDYQGQLNRNRASLSIQLEVWNNFENRKRRAALLLNQDAAFISPTLIYIASQVDPINEYITRNALWLLDSGYLPTPSYELSFYLPKDELSRQDQITATTLPVLLTLPEAISAVTEDRVDYLLSFHDIPELERQHIYADEGCVIYQS